MERNREYQISAEVSRRKFISIPVLFGEVFFGAIWMQTQKHSPSFSKSYFQYGLLFSYKIRAKPKIILL